MSQLDRKLASSTDLDLGPLRSSLGFTLRMAQLRAFERYFEVLGATELSPGEFATLVVINSNPQASQGEVARALKIKPAHMTKLVVRLVDAGLVQRHVPIKDRRSVRLKLTDEGQRFLRANQASYLHAPSIQSAGISDKEQDELLRMLWAFIEVDTSANEGALS